MEKKEQLLIIKPEHELKFRGKSHKTTKKHTHLPTSRNTFVQRKMPEMNTNADHLKNFIIPGLKSSSTRNYGHNLLRRREKNVYPNEPYVVCVSISWSKKIVTFFGKKKIRCHSLHIPFSPFLSIEWRNWYFLWRIKIPYRKSNGIYFVRNRQYRTILWSSKLSWMEKKNREIGFEWRKSAFICSLEWH